MDPTTLGREINLLEHYPKANRPIDERGEVITDEVRDVARRYGEEFFDGDRLYGYGGYRYDGRWVPIAARMREFYELGDDAKILDIGCAKGFLLHDFSELMPHAEVTGLEISQYAIDQAMPSVRDRIRLGNANDLPFEDNSFDLVLSINTVHNLPTAECAHALREIERVGRGKSFVSVDAWRDDAGRERLMKWMLTAETFMSCEDWVEFFAAAGYRGDYYWFFA